MVCSQVSQLSCRRVSVHCYVTIYLVLAVWAGDSFELFKANSFNTLGAQDVLVTLLNNLKVQERQNRVCTTVAIAIVAETCAPFTVLPALMNEYRTPELNVQNGVLKALSFMFEYIGEMGKVGGGGVLCVESCITKCIPMMAIGCHGALAVMFVSCRDA